MKNIRCVISLLFFITTIDNGGAQPAQLDALIGSFRHFRREIFDLVNRTAENRHNFQLLRSRDKLQRFIKKKYPCPINNTRSPEIPQSVHKLRPGDIDVIGGIGDSLTAGVGLLATNFLQVWLEHRGFSATAGGKGSWQKFLTVPNILKTFNPNLTGYATETSLTLHPESHLNLGETAAMSEDMPYMVTELIKRMRADPRINIDKQWKMVNFMIGPNNFCNDICLNDNVTFILEKHKRELREVLTILKENLPRTVVNLVPPPNLKLLLDFEPKLHKCVIQHLMECPCLFGPTSRNRQDLYVKIMELWQNIDIELGNSDDFDTDIFTVVVQPFALNFTIPTTADGSTDYTYFSEDCFHMSQKGNARTHSFWNNVMEPVGEKSTHPVEFFQEIKCPSEDRPFIYTRRNSITY